MSRSRGTKANRRVLRAKEKPPGKDGLTNPLAAGILSIEKGAVGRRMTLYKIGNQKDDRSG